MTNKELRDELTAMMVARSGNWEGELAKNLLSRLPPGDGELVAVVKCEECEYRMTCSCDVIYRMDNTTSTTDRFNCQHLTFCSAGKARK